MAKMALEEKERELKSRSITSGQVAFFFIEVEEIKHVICLSSLVINGIFKSIAENWECLVTPKIEGHIKFIELLGRSC